jgi:hypothetical protein
MADYEFGPLTRLVNIYFPSKQKAGTWDVNVTLNVGTASGFGALPDALCYASLVSTNSMNEVVNKYGPIPLNVVPPEFNFTKLLMLTGVKDTLTISLQITMNEDAYDSNNIAAGSRNVFNLYFTATHRTKQGKTYNVTSVPVVSFNPDADGFLGNGNLGPVYYHNSDFGDILQWSSPFNLVIGNPTSTVNTLGFGYPVSGP